MCPGLEWLEHSFRISSKYLPANPKVCSVSPISQFGSVGLLSNGQETNRLQSIRSHRDGCLLWSVVRVLIRVLAPAPDDDIEGWYKQERENGGRGQTANHNDGKWLRDKTSRTTKAQSHWKQGQNSCDRRHQDWTQTVFTSFNNGSTCIQTLLPILPYQVQ